MNWTVFAVKVSLDNSTCSVIMACYTLTQLCNEGVECKNLGIAVHSIDYIHRRDHIYFAVQHWQGVDRSLLRVLSKICVNPSVIEVSDSVIGMRT